MNISKDKSRRILLTGGTSGIGYNSTISLIKDGHEVIILSRSQKRSDEILLKLKKEISNKYFIEGKCKFVQCDLSDLYSIEDSCDKILNKYKYIDTLVLNAGLQYTGSKDSRLSNQKIEITFAVNHLSHQFICQKLFGLLLKSNKPRIVITSSEVHNPLSSGGRIGKPAGLGNLRGLDISKEIVMLDGISEFNSDKAYKDSKLCNILFGKELAKKIIERDCYMPVICWAPGLIIPKTNQGFFRYSRKNNELGQRIFAFLARDVFQISESVERAGQILSMLSTSSNYQHNGFSYYANSLIRPGKMRFAQGVISKEASDKKKASMLWVKSNNLINQFCKFETI